MKHTYYIQYWDKQEKIKYTFVKAKSETQAQCKFYKKYKYELIRKISLV